MIRIGLMCILSLGLTLFAFDGRALAQGEEDKEASFDGWEKKEQPAEKADEKAEAKEEASADEKTEAKEEASADETEEGRTEAKPEGKKEVQAEVKKEVEVKETRKAAPTGVGALRPGEHMPILPSVCTRYGSLTLLGVFQTRFDMNFVPKYADGADGDTLTGLAFQFHRARIMLKGHVLNENLTYFFQGDAANTFSFVLDMFLGYNFDLAGQKFGLRVGRFVPDFGFMMPRNTADLAAINYPVYLTGSGGFAVWRQMGVQLNYKPTDALAVNLGVFNGLQLDPFSLPPLSAYMQMANISAGGTTISNWGDNNKAKDILLSANYKIGNLSLALNTWFGMPVNATDDSENDFIFMGGPGAEYNNGKMHIVGEFMFRILDYGPDGADSVTSLGAWGHLGYRLNDLIEVVGRLDWYEPNLDNDADMLMRITAGAHFWLEEKHFRILLNLFTDIPLEEMDNRNVGLGVQTQFAALW